MQMNRTRNASRNIIWGIVEKCASLILPFITRTLMIRILGTEYLGLGSLFSSILQVLSISELGFGSAIAFSMYKPIAEDDNETVCALLNFYKKIYSYVGTIILVAGIIISPFITNFINGDPPQDVNVYILYYIYLANTVISYFMYAYKAVLFTAHQRNDLASKRATIVNIISCLLQSLCLLLLRNYYAYVIIIPIATVVTNLLNAQLAKRTYPNITCHGTISKDMRDSIKKRVLGLLSFKINNVIFASVDTIVVSSFLGLTALAIYNNYYYIQNTLVGFLSILTTSITAGVGNKMVTNSKDDNYRDFKNVVFANGWVCSWCSVCLLCLYQHFINWWIGEDYLFSFDTMVLMVLYFLLPRITTITYTYREAAGLWWEDRIRPIVSSVVNLTVNIILVQIIGMNGVIISTLICTIFIATPWGTIILFKKYFERSPMEYFLKLLYYILITALAGVITFFLCSLLPNIGFGIMLAKGAICVVVPNLVFLLFYHRLKEFDYVKMLLVRIEHSALQRIKK